jgi:hypothetical protein
VRFLLPIFACSGLVACTPPPSRPLERPAEARVAAYTDSSPVQSLAAAAPFLLVGTGDGLLRWDLRGGTPRPVLSPELAPPRGVHAIALLDGGRTAVVPMAGGLGRIDVSSGELIGVSAAPAADTTATADVRALAVTPDGDTWLGGPTGLTRVSPDGVWTPGVLTSPVDVLWASPRGELLAGGPGGLLRRTDDGFAPMDAESGCDLVDVRFIVTAPDGNPLIIGAGRDGSARIAIRVAGVFVTYRVTPTIRIVASATRGRTILLATTTRLYQLVLRSDVRSPIERDGARLSPVGAAPRAPFVILPARTSLPAGVTALAATSDDIFAGTAAIGTATWKGGARRPHWLRRGDLAPGPGIVTVGCAAQACLLATGDGALWRFDGGFSRVAAPAVDAEVLAVADGAGGEGPWVIWRDTQGAFAGQRDARSGEATTRVVPVMMFSLDTRILFARVGGGALWLGAAELDGEVTLLRTSLVGADPDWIMPSAVLGTLVDLEVTRGGHTVWLLGEHGVAELGGALEDVAPLVGAPARALAVTAGGLLAVVGPRGVAIRTLAGWQPVRGAPGGFDLGVDRKGRLWVATRTGLVVGESDAEGGRFQRLETRAGVLAEPITHLTRDRRGRLWTSSPQGLGIVEP